MPSKRNSDRNKHQKDLEEDCPEGANAQAQKGNKRDRDDTPVHSAVAISPEAKQGSFVAYMTGLSHPSTPRRGVGKKKTKAEEDMMDDVEDDEIQDTFNAIRKAEAD